MILTGKTKDNFEKWLYENHRVYIDDIHKMEFKDDLLLNALIIEFFDSVGIYIHIDNLTNCTKDGIYLWHGFIKQNYKNRKRIKYWHDTRQEATTEAIIKANEIYNAN